MIYEEATLKDLPIEIEGELPVRMFIEHDGILFNDFVCAPYFSVYETLDYMNDILNTAIPREAVLCSLNEAVVAPTKTKQKRIQKEKPTEESKGWFMSWFYSLLTIVMSLFKK
jgi:lantibiotic modifying enzyme